MAAVVVKKENRYFPPSKKGHFSKLFFYCTRGRQFCQIIRESSFSVFVVMNSAPVVILVWPWNDFDRIFNRFNHTHMIRQYTVGPGWGRTGGAVDGGCSGWLGWVGFRGTPLICVHTQKAWSNYYTYRLYILIPQTPHRPDPPYFGDTHHLLRPNNHVWVNYYNIAA